MTAGGWPVKWDPKGLREHLCVQASVSPDEFTRALIGRLIRLMDVHRPIGNDGKHDNRHTTTCGCHEDDK